MRKPQQHTEDSACAVLAHRAHSRIPTVLSRLGKPQLRRAQHRQQPPHPALRDVAACRHTSPAAAHHQPHISQTACSTQWQEPMMMVHLRASAGLEQRAAAQAPAAGDAAPEPLQRAAGWAVRSPGPCGHSLRPRTRRRHLCCTCTARPQQQWALGPPATARLNRTGGQQRDTPAAAHMPLHAPAGLLHMLYVQAGTAPPAACSS